MRRTLLGLLLLGAATLVVLAPLSRGDGEGAEVSRSFTFSSSPADAVLTVTKTGGLSGKSSVYTLFGDGRLRYERRGSATVVYESSEATLSYQDAQHLLAIAVDHGLVDTSQQDLLAGINDPHVVADAGKMTVEIHLASYTRNGEDQGSVSNTLRLTDPWALRRFNPDNTTIAGMVELSTRLADYRERLRAGDSR